jgi:hypothetical protein
VTDHDFYRDYITEAGELLRFPPGPGDVLTRLSSALGGGLLQAVVPRCTCGWRGVAIDRLASDPNSGRPDQDAFSQWFLGHMPET